VPGIIAINSSDSSYRRVLKEEIARLESLGFNLIRSQDGGEWQDLFATARTGGLFSSKGFIRVESAEELGRLPDSLVEKVEAANAASTFLILVYSRDHKKFFPKEIQSTIRILSVQKVPRWLNRRFDWLKEQADKRKIRIEKNALMFLADTIEDPDEMISELDKLSYSAKNNAVSLEMVKDLVLDEGRNAMLDVIDGICMGKTEEVIKALEVLKRGSELIPVLSAIYNRIRIAVIIHSLGKYGKDRIKQILKFRDYQFRMGNELLRRYRPEDLFVFATEVITLDYREKTNDARGWPGLECSILKFLASVKR
jgi:DNA polymerase-3 subunit delta